jgi:hypothetical protein
MTAVPSNCLNLSKFFTAVPVLSIFRITFFKVDSFLNSRQFSMPDLNYASSFITVIKETNKECKIAVSNFTLLVSMGLLS